MYDNGVFLKLVQTRDRLYADIEVDLDVIIQIVITLLVIVFKLLRKLSLVKH
jgi:hypothetical protein